MAGADTPPGRRMLRAISLECASRFGVFLVVVAINPLTYAAIGCLLWTAGGECGKYHGDVWYAITGFVPSAVIALIPALTLKRRWD